MPGGSSNGLSAFEREYDSLIGQSHGCKDQHCHIITYSEYVYCKSRTKRKFAAGSKISFVPPYRHGHRVHVHDPAVTINNKAPHTAMENIRAPIGATSAIYKKIRIPIIRFILGEAFLYYLECKLFDTVFGWEGPVHKLTRTRNLIAKQGKQHPNIRTGSPVDGVSFAAAHWPAHLLPSHNLNSKDPSGLTSE